MSGTVLGIIKCGIALCACGALSFEVLSARRARWVMWTLRACALLAAAAYFQFGAVARSGFVHRWEMFHYYIGAKYHAELGYEGLYGCVAQADAEARVKGALARKVRDLQSDGLTTGRHAIAVAACPRHFTPARWLAFRDDVARFRGMAQNRRFWESMQRDHGYNPPPLWTLVGRSLASMGPPTHRFLMLLASFDVALMAAAIAALLWAFGERVAWLAVVFWGTQAASEFGWTGGGFLRQDWLFFSILACCLLRKNWPLAAGAALAIAALLRVFPALLTVGPLVVVVASVLRERRLRPAHARVLIGASLVGLSLLLLSAGLVGVQSYPRFFEHIQLRHTSPITNHMSLRTLFAFSPDLRLATLVDGSLPDPGAPWVAARQARLSALAPLYGACALVLTAAVVFVCFRVRSMWMALALSLPLVPALTDPSCYYYSVWVLSIVLARARPAIAIPLLGVAVAGQALSLGHGEFETRFAALALLYVISALPLLAAFSDHPLARWRRFRLRRAMHRPPAASTRVFGTT
jgi:hypothetical protein